MPVKKSSAKTRSVRRRGGRVAVRRRAPMRRMKVARAPANSCKIVEYFDAIAIEANVANEFVVNGIVPTTIGGKATRAATVAQAFGLYRIADVQYKLTPRFDTFASGLAPGGDAPVEVPKVYWKINRFGDNPLGFTQDDMLSLGCKPIRLDDKTVTIQYKPNILLANTGVAAAAQAGGSGQLKMTPWLSTEDEPDQNGFQLSTTRHYGHIMFIECAAGGDGTPIVCEMTARVVYEFKNPRVLEDEHEAAKRALVKHVLHTPGKVELRQAQGLQPDGWNLQNTTPV